MRSNSTSTSSATTTAAPRRAAPRLRRVTAVLAMAALPFLTGCNLRQYMGMDMYNQPKVAKPMKPSDFFADGTNARPLVQGTVPRSEVYADRSSVGIEPVLYAGDGYPPDFLKEGETLQAKLNRGQTVFNVYCAVCHGQTGLGDGMIVQRSFVRPPSFVVPSTGGKPNDEAKKMELADPHRWDRTKFLQDAPPRHVYNAITNGFGAMYSYNDRVSPADRWAVAAYIKALQASPPETGPLPTPSDKPGVAQ